MCFKAMLPNFSVRVCLSLSAFREMENMVVRDSQAVVLHV